MLLLTSISSFPIVIMSSVLALGALNLVSKSFFLLCNAAKSFSNCSNKRCSLKVNLRLFEATCSVFMGSALTAAALAALFALLLANSASA